MRSRKNASQPAPFFGQSLATLHHRAAAINLRRLITLGLVHDGTAWALS